VRASTNTPPAAEGSGNAISPYTVLIPARLSSTRLPNKPLADLNGRPMVVRVAERALLSRASQVVVAADHPSIIEACHAYGIQALLTRTDHVSGSDRLAEACEQLALSGDDAVVNVQGDEPLIDPLTIDAVAQLLFLRNDCSMSTVAHEIDNEADYLNPNVVKVVVDAHSTALYFSRAPIPWWRDGLQGAWPSLPSPRPLRHVGLYGYRAGFLRSFPSLPASPIETLESLEQLRAMWHGHRIAVHLSSHAPGPGVDTPEDLERVRLLFSGLDT
jgi:3-deoxy-manno-octulosonate cytidylyltransferase (CMP-KDO synthetase)